MDIGLEVDRALGRWMTRNRHQYEGGERAYNGKAWVKNGCGVSSRNRMNVGGGRLNN